MNKKIIEQFNLLINQVQAEYLNAQVENDMKEMKIHTYRLKNIKKVLSIIKKLDFEIKNSTDLEEISGIGKGTLRRIDEILKTGYLDELDKKYDVEKQNKINSIRELTQIIGIGPKVAKKLVIEHHITNINELKKAIKNGRYVPNQKILLGLKYYGVVQGNIPRKEINDIEKFLNKEMYKIDKKLSIIICGSYRRGKQQSGDIDILMYHPDIILSKHIHNPTRFYLEEFVDELKNNGFLLDHLTDKNYKMKYMGFSKFKSNPIRRIDIRFIPYNSIYTALLYFTGPYELNTEMRIKAEKRGMILNEYGLYKFDKDGEKISVKINSEADVFEKLGMKYLTPIEREIYSIGKNK
uniref:DNA polymerase beta n=1 Tax=viral metagenome TaxID=1070528 RepID=A0A6C0LUF2_9ZZZZ